MPSKNILFSKTFWGALIGMLAMFFPHMLSYVGASDPTQVANKIVAVIGFVLVVYGRIKARQPINLFGGNSNIGVGGMGVFLALALLFTFGCNAQASAQKFSNILSGILNIAKAEIPALPPGDAVYITHWVNLGVTLDGQLNTCITSSGGKKAVLSSCFNAFASGLLNPAELAQLKIMSPTAQSKVQLYATAAIIGVNAALAEFGGVAVPTPVVAPTPTTTAEISDFSQFVASSYHESLCPADKHLVISNSGVTFSYACEP